MKLRQVTFFTVDTLIFRKREEMDSWEYSLGCK